MIVHPLTRDQFPHPLLISRFVATLVASGKTIDLTKGDWSRILRAAPSLVAAPRLLADLEKLIPIAATLRGVPVLIQNPRPDEAREAFINFKPKTK